MTTTRSARPFSSPIAQNSSPPSLSTKTPYGLERLRTAILALPAKTKTASEWPGISLGQRQTLMTLAGCLPTADAGIFDSKQAVSAQLHDLYKITCYTEHATACHIRALTRAGWLYAEAGWHGEAGTYFLSPAIELYAELVQLQERENHNEQTSASEQESLRQQKEQITYTILTELRLNRERSAAQKPKLRQRSACARDPHAIKKDRLFEIATALSGRANAGLSYSYLLKDLIDLCASDATTVSNEPSLPAPPAPDTAPSKEPPRERKPLSPEEQKKAVLLRNELFLISHRLDSKTLGPQIISFARDASLEELEKKLVALRLLARGKG